MKPFESKRIALDFDDTFTLDPELWSFFIGLAKGRGFDVKFVTFRYMMGPNEDINYWSDKLDTPIIYCDGVQKATVCAQQGWIPDVWIDDFPVLIPMKQQLQGMILGIEKNGG
ncbi:hypothetical protein [Staphylococcus haemolyticus]|uniref:Uncharacterized protein n=1 Tax=Cronobacter phage vB_CsaM_GAP31 TaxID=1141135 RepID=K4F946_9CAUD|nr:hypothetical protein [Staphylococcus haemolyticus]YP_006986875.1 hypothetical protein GAP31_040 [Cronobacter phage vB_CsaM_GAP31]AFC21220.1 hypothetical protein GAP31_040 [Cronobacter phage vB_CsaM_GAP31]MCC3723248.1 hypothetical protein [Staphylococcus haemolyticus]